MEELLYAVLLKNPADFQLGRVARARAAAREEPEHDLVASTRKGWGVLAEELSREQADLLAFQLSTSGLPALAAPQNLIETPPGASPISGMRLESSGLRASPESVFSGILPWSALDLVCAVALRRPLARRPGLNVPTLGQKISQYALMFITGLPLPLRPRPPKEPPPATYEPAFFVDLAWSAPRIRLRIDCHAFDYSCLKTRMGYESLGNLRRLLADLRTRAPRALLNAGADALLEGRTLAGLGHDSLEDLDRECRWLLTLRSLKLA